MTMGPTFVHFFGVHLLLGPIVLEPLNIPIRIHGTGLYLPTNLPEKKNIYKQSTIHGSVCYYAMTRQPMGSHGIFRSLDPMLREEVLLSAPEDGTEKKGQPVENCVGSGKGLLPTSQIATR